MPNLDFYAAERDLKAVLDFVFTERQCRVFESYSAYDAELVEFGSTAEISRRSALGVLQGTVHDPLLQLVPVKQVDHASIRRISLDPHKCNGATFRYCIEGWGLIQLYLGGVGPSGFVESHTNHNSEKRALAWEPTYADELRPVQQWDWPEITRISNRINRKIRTMAVARAASRPVLPHAAALIEQGHRPHNWPHSLSGFVRQPQSG